MRIELREEFNQRRFVWHIILQQYFEPGHLKQKTASFLLTKEGAVDLPVNLLELVKPISVHERVDVSPMQRPHPP